MAWNQLQKVSLYSLFALLLCPAVVNAQAIKSEEISNTSADTISPRLGVDFNTPRNGDDERSFGRVTGFIPLWQTPGNSLTFLDTAVRLNSTGDLGGTVTLGQRFLKNGLVLGGHLSYDVRDTGRNTFNQLGLGVEAFGDKWDVHLNGYLPVGDTQQSAGSSSSSSGSVSGTQFQGNQLVFITTGGSEFLESAWGGVDLDAGIQLADWADWGQLWGYGGVYYHGDAIGGRLRVDHRVQDWMRVGLGVQSDDNFGTRGFFSLGFSWGGSSGSGSNGELGGESVSESVLWARAAESVTRNSSIVVKESEVVMVGGIEVAINPVTGQAYSFQHVTPDATATAGDGSIENPYANVTLVNAQAGDVVYVATGDSRTNPLAPFTVPTGVTILSTALAESITTQVGDIALPGSGTGILPLVDATGIDSGITLTGAGSRISGFEVFGSNQSGIIASNAPNAIIENNISRDHTLAAIAVRDASTGTIVRNNQLDANGAGIGIATSADVLVQNNQITNSLGLGIGYVDTTGGIVENNTVSNSSGGAIGILTADGITIRNNQVTNINTDIGTLGSPAAILAGNVSGEFNISNNTVTGTTGSQLFNGQGIFIANNTGNMALTLANNTISNNQGDGVSVFLGGDATATLNITNNMIENNGADTPSLRGDGIKIAVEENGEITQLAIANNTLNGNVDDGLDISLGLFQNFPIPVIPIAIPGIGTTIGASSAQVSNATISGNTITNNQNGQGIVLRSVGDDSSLVISVEGNTLTGNGSTGVSAQSFDANSDSSTDLCLALNNNDSDNGYQLTEAPLSTFTVVNRDAVDGANAGTVTLLPLPASFDTAADIDSCP
ncbi:right-handed parallel beta-helix repeat-containing protein [Leptolyngbya cf. ectocarpi LEGE 11479]|uniref:Right-handed parallel beta-helix repeat-containing protein n=1 Tax=Leptolyngbya cf. ectocarpi LEGE 11479 TaxID=1828722 RepID=A0A928X1C0_LEPEC|nr:right-handed parallel beta-helix repeat-containing protein [Leptolyngbya ectocarpi]MBE9066006.1 right-handed parallel beta-helix repeat-containing protein [Leptolyngbya cf. ectocarpi LEGE 11479]